MSFKTFRRHSFLHFCEFEWNLRRSVEGYKVAIDGRGISLGCRHIGVVTTTGSEPNEKTGGVVIEASVVSIVVIREGEDWLGQIHYREALIP